MSDRKKFENQLRDYKQQVPAKVLPEKPKACIKIDKVMVNKLTSELADALIDKRKCEVENESLKMENRNYETRVKLLLSEISCLKLIQGNNIMAIEQKVTHIQSQMQPKANNVTSETINQINTLNNTITDLKQNESNLKAEILRFKEKYQQYKEKLKFSINIITNLNKHLTDKGNNLKEIGCQTEKEYCHVERPAFEEQIISELFFRDRPYHDDENLMFLRQEQFTDIDKNCFY